MPMLEVKRKYDGSVLYPESDHDDMNLNANLQVNESDNAASNPAFVTSTDLGKKSSASCTRPNDTTAYTALDVVGTAPATNMTFSDVYGVAAAEIIINRVELEIDVNAVPSGMSTFVLHLYDAAPTAITDNSAYNLPSGDRAKYLGNITIDQPVDLGDTLYVSMIGVNFQCKLAAASTTLYGILQTVGGFTPSASTVKKVTIHTLGA